MGRIACSRVWFFSRLVQCVMFTQCIVINSLRMKHYLSQSIHTCTCICYHTLSHLCTTTVSCTCMCTVWNVLVNRHIHVPLKLILSVPVNDACHSLSFLPLQLKRWQIIVLRWTCLSGLSHLPLLFHLGKTFRPALLLPPQLTSILLFLYQHRPKNARYLHPNLNDHLKWSNFSILILIRRITLKVQCILYSVLSTTEESALLDVPQGAYEEMEYDPDEMNRNPPSLVETSSIPHLLLLYNIFTCRRWEDSRRPSCRQ